MYNKIIWLFILLVYIEVHYFYSVHSNEFVCFMTSKDNHSKSNCVVIITRQTINWSYDLSTISISYAVYTATMCLLTTYLLMWKVMGNEIKLYIFRFDNSHDSGS